MFWLSPRGSSRLVRSRGAAWSPFAKLALVDAGFAVSCALMRPKAWLAGVVLALSFAPRPARADGWEGFYRVIQVGEIVIPDLGLEVTAERKNLVLTWPVQFVAVRPFPALRDAFVRPSGNLLVEPQWVPGQKIVRGLVGTRWHFRLGKRRDDGSISDWGLVSDLGVVGGSDGAGVATGVGVGWLDWDADAPGSGALMYRYTWLVDEPYHSVLLDLFALPFARH
jgi:hypothetical protein